MKKVMDKLRFKVQYDKNLVLFLIIITIIGILTGSILVTMLNESDNNLVNNYLNDFLNNMDKLDYLNGLKNNLLSNIYVILIWLLGISIIGLPIIILIYFTKIFILGFSIGSIISVFKTRGIIFILGYIPGQIFSLIVYFILTMYAMAFSFKLIYVIFKKQTINFKLVMNKYFKVLIYSLIFIILISLYDAYIMPNIIKYLITFIR